MSLGTIITICGVVAAAFGAVYDFLISGGN